ncbi:MAG: 2-oxoacid:acceptor oxidoreductase family protein [Syntrophaceae bacterium]|nr:2-oxoacid:acceptor oxidoreductase family protein [Syntrophaceae bacterium]
MKRIVFAGIGGQSVRVISHILAMALKELGYEVALLFDYDSSIRNQRITAYLTYDQKPIENPMIEEADILIRLHEKGDQLVAQKTICDTGLCTDEEVPFGKIGMEKFGQVIFGNMIALGRLFRLIDIDISRMELEKFLPKSYVKENLKAIQYGYDVNLYED